MAPRYRRARTDYPDGVIAIYDNGGRTVDRFTVVYEPVVRNGLGESRLDFGFVVMSPNPTWPLGVCMHSSAPYYNRPLSDWGTGNRGSGKVIRFEDLPEDCQRVVREDLAEAAEAQ